MYNFSEEQNKIIHYLKSSVKKGKSYFKSKHIAQDIGSSPKSVGINLLILANECEELIIQKRSRSNATTWQVSVRKHTRSV